MVRQTARSRALDSKEVAKSRGHWNREDHIRHRDYSPTLGRFIERDPIGFEAGDSNLYRFSANSPADVTDPGGETSSKKPSQFDPGWYQLASQTVGRREGMWGDFMISTNWLVNPRAKASAQAGTNASGWIIQHVVAIFDVKDQNGRRVDHPADDGKWGYWEAWEVTAGKASPVPNQKMPNVDDQFAIWGGIRNTCGTIIIKGIAQFYPNQRLPADFRPHSNIHAKSLPATHDRNAIVNLIPRSFPATVHVATATWSSTENGGKTHLVESASRPISDGVTA